MSVNITADARYSKNVDSLLCSIRLQRYDKKSDCFLYFLWLFIAIVLIIIILIKNAEI
jgi:hypothetical protein